MRLLRSPAGCFLPISIDLFHVEGVKKYCTETMIKKSSFTTRYSLILLQSGGLLRSKSKLPGRMFFLPIVSKAETVLYQPWSRRVHSPLVTAWFTCKIVVNSGHLYSCWFSLPKTFFVEVKKKKESFLFSVKPGRPAIYKSSFLYGQFSKTWSWITVFNQRPFGAPQKTNNRLMVAFQGWSRTKVYIYFYRNQCEIIKRKKFNDAKKLPSSQLQTTHGVRWCF